MTRAPGKWAYTLILALTCAGAFAHVPYIEDRDYPEGEDFVITDAEQSKAFYAYLDAGDVDGFTIVLDEPGRIYVSTLIPFCKEYAFFDVNYALIGPGLPRAEEPVPVAVPEGEGVIVHTAGFPDWADRPLMYEYFSDRRYFEGRGYTHRSAPAGTYRFVLWHKDGLPGDYTAIVGRREMFSRSDRQLSMQNMPTITRKQELRGECEDTGNFALWFDRDDTDTE